MKHSARFSKTVSRLSHARSDRRTPEVAGHDAAERRTEAVLARLPGERWSILAAESIRYTAVDHVAVGPGGVYMIASRQPVGCVRVKEGVAWLRHGDDPRSARASLGLQRKVVDPARQLQRDVQRRGADPAAVHAVVVLWSEFPQLVAETSQVAYVHGRSLAAWLAAREPKLGEGERERMIVAVSDAVRERRSLGSRIARRHAA